MKQKFLALGYLSVLLGLILTLLLVHIGIIKQGSNIAIEIIASLILMYAPLLTLDIFKKDQAANAFFIESQTIIKHVRRGHRSTFPNPLQQTGAIGRDLRAAPMPRRTTGGRQHGGASTASRQAASGKSSSDDDGGDGEPPREQQLYSYSRFAQLLDCSVKTLRNKVSSGLFQKPIKTAFGPRFTPSHLALVLAPQQPPAPQSMAQKRGPGRPRLAHAAGKEGAA